MGQGKDWRKTSVADRTQYVLTLVRPATASKNDQGMGELVRRIEERTGEVVNKGEISRLASGGRKDPKPQTLRRVADGAPVSYVWLSLGEGQPEDPNPWGPNYVRELELAVAFGGGIGWYGITRVESLRQIAPDFPGRTAREWLDELEAARNAKPKSPSSPPPGSGPRSNKKHEPRQQADTVPLQRVPGKKAKHG
jgi:transcriptional regulator with XRE-family HTH domain